MEALIIIAVVAILAVGLGSGGDVDILDDIERHEKAREKDSKHIT